MANSNEKVAIWEVTKKSLLSTLSGHSFLISDVRFGPPTTSSSASSSFLASGSYDKTVRLWKAWDTEDQGPTVCYS